MLLMPNKKKIATLIVSGAKPDYVQKMGEKSEDKPIDMSQAESDDEYGIGLEASAEKMISAFKAGSAASLVSALKEFMEMCNHNSYGD